MNTPNPNQGLKNLESFLALTCHYDPSIDYSSILKQRQKEAAERKARHEKQKAKKA